MPCDGDAGPWPVAKRLFQLASCSVMGMQFKCVEQAFAARVAVAGAGEKDTAGGESIVDVAVERGELRVIEKLSQPRADRQISRRDSSAAPARCPGGTGWRELRNWR